MSAQRPSSTSAPRQDEAPSEYMDRMLGKPGTPERRLASAETYQYYLRIWDSTTICQKRENQHENPR